MLILIVDSDVELSVAISDALVAEYPVSARATNASEALTFLRAGLRPDLILLDMFDPTTSGAAFLEALMHAEYATIPVVAMTGCRSDPRPLRAAGVLVKPFGHRELFAAIAAHAQAPMHPSWRPTGSDPF